jgi:tripartite motif-containing protein 71
MQLARRSFLRLSALGTASLVLPLAGSGCAGTTAVAVRPGGAGELLFFDAEGRLLELQPGAHRVLVHPALEGDPPAVLGGFGTGPAQLNGPTSLALGPEGRVAVADWGNGRVQVYSRTGQYLQQVGRRGSGQEELSSPFGVCVDDAGNLWVSDTLHHRVQRYAADGTWLDSVGEGELNAPLGLALGPEGQVHVVEAGGARVSVFSTSGVKMREYGGVEVGLLSPRAIAVDAEGTAYVTDATAAALFVFSAAGALRDRMLVTREGAPAAPLHVALGPTGALEVATLPAAPV